MMNAIASGIAIVIASMAMPWLRLRTISPAFPA
jgi:hypothetical protein